MEARLRAYIKRLKEPCGCDYQCGCGVLDAYQVGVYLESLLPKESKMLTAAEARRRVEEAIEGDAKAWINDTDKRIEQAILAKSFSVARSYNSTIYSFCKKHYQAKGFKVEYYGGGHSGSSSVTISW